MGGLNTFSAEFWDSSAIRTGISPAKIGRFTHWAVGRNPRLAGAVIQNSTGSLWHLTAKLGQRHQGLHKAGDLIQNFLSCRWGQMSMSVPQVLYRVLSFTLHDQILWKCERLQNRVDSEARPRSSKKRTYKRPSTFWKQKNQARGQVDTCETHRGHGISYLQHEYPVSSDLHQAVVH